MTTSSNAHDYRTKVFAWARAAGLKQVRLVIFQPKADGITERVMSLADLEAFAEDLQAKAEAVQRADAAFRNTEFAAWWPLHLNTEPNEVDCAWCRAKPECPSATAKLQRDAAADFHAVHDEDGQVVADPTTLKPVDLSTAMKVVPLMESWLKAVRAEVERRLLAGTPVVDFGLELGRQGNREVSDPEEAERLVRKQFRVPIEHAYSMKLKSVTQLEKLTKPGKAEDGSVTPPVIGPKQWKQFETLIVRADAKPSVKPLSAIKNPWIPPQISADEFKSVDDASDLA